MPQAIPRRIDSRLAYRALDLAEELARRAKRRKCLYNPRFLTELLYPPDDPSFQDFWKRFSEPTDWLLQLCLAWKARGVIEVLPGFHIQMHGSKDRESAGYEKVDLSQFTTLLILQSRETLKTAIRRIDAIHDMAYFPIVREEPCTIAWFAHKLPEAIRNGQAIRAAMCASDAFFDVWGGVLVPKHRNPDKWGTHEYFNTPNHPRGMPERTMAMLAVKARYEGGRYKAGHFDDLVTGEDRDSLAVREEKKRNIKDRENERDRTVGYRVIQGTYYHPEDAYNELQRQEGVITLKLPAVAGDPRKFFEFWDLDRFERKKRLDEFTEECKPVFGHLDLLTLAKSCDQQKPRLFSSQMLLRPELGGQQVFDIRNFVWIDRDEIPKGLPSCLFCDPAFKKPENRHEGDYNAMGLVMFDQYGRVIIADGAYRNDWGESDVFQYAGQLIHTYRPLSFYMEQKFQNDINPHWQQHCFRHNIPIPYIMPLQRAGSANKMTRIQSMEPMISSARVVLVRGVQICEAIEHEAKQYDRITGAEHDDALDMLAQTQDPAVPKFNTEWQSSGGWDSAADSERTGQHRPGRATVEDTEVWLP